MYIYVLYMCVCMFLYVCMYVYIYMYIYIYIYATRLLLAKPAVTRIIVAVTTNIRIDIHKQVHNTCTYIRKHVHIGNIHKYVHIGNTHKYVHIGYSSCACQAS